MRPAVTVVIPTRNRPLLLRQALASVAAQDLPGVEAMVVNDGGEDVTTVVGGFSGDLEVRLITLATNRGLSAARNAGIDAARGRFVAFLDDDDVYLPHHLRTAISSLEGSGADFAYTSCLVSDCRVEPSGPWPTATPAAFDYPFDADALSVINFIPVTGVVCRSLRGLQARFDPSLPVLEDLDMWLRLVRRNAFRVVHVPEVTVVYHRVPAARSMTAVADPAQVRRFGVAQRRLYRRWPVPSGSRLERFRHIVLWMRQLAHARLRVGETLAHFYYERALRLVLDGLAGRLDEHAVLAGLPAAIAGERR